MTLKNAYIFICGAIFGCAIFGYANESQFFPPFEMTEEQHGEHKIQTFFVDSNAGCKIALVVSTDTHYDDYDKYTSKKLALISQISEKLLRIKAKSQIHWDGACKDGYADGIGAEISPDGEITIAEYKDKIPRYVLSYTPIAPKTASKNTPTASKEKGDYKLFIAEYEDYYKDISDNRDGLLVQDRGRSIKIDSSFYTMRVTCTNECADGKGSPLIANSSIGQFKAYKGAIKESFVKLKKSTAIARSYIDKICKDDLANRPQNRQICEVPIDYTSEMDSTMKMLEHLTK